MTDVYPSMTDSNGTDSDGTDSVVSNPPVDDPPTISTIRPHTTVLRFPYPSAHYARIVDDALAPEVGEIDDPRSAVTVDRDGAIVSVHVTADDLLALRAGINSWIRLVAVAERVAGVPTTD